MESETFISGMVALGSALGGAIASLVTNIIKDNRTRPIVRSVLDEHFAPLLLRMDRLELEIRHMGEVRALDRERHQLLREQLEIAAHTQRVEGKDHPP